MSKLLVVAREEIRFHLSQWSFYLSLVVMVGMFVAAGALPRLQSAVSDSPLAEVETVFTTEETIATPTGYVDYSGLLMDIPHQQQMENLYAFTTEAAAKTALQNGTIDRYYVIAADYIESGRVTEFSLEAQLLVGTDQVIVHLLRQSLLYQLDDPNLSARLETPAVITYNGPPVPTFNFVPPDLDTSQLGAAALVAIFFTFLINIGGALLLRALQRETEAQVFEIVITSTTPAQFLGGKLLGLSLVVLGQASVTLLAGLLVYGQNPGGVGPAKLTPDLLLISLPYILLGYLAYSGLMLDIAALMPALPESTQLQFIIRLMSLLPLVGVIFILPDANGTIAIILTLIPIFSPLLMPFRVFIAPVPFWQIGLSLLFLGLWASFLIGLSMRLFRLHTLLTGRTPVLTALWTALKG